jgi:beta-lactamase class D
VGPAGKRGVLIGGVVIMIAIVVAGVVILSGNNTSTAATPEDVDQTTAASLPALSPAALAKLYLQAFAADNVNGAAQLTDDPQAAATALGDAWHELGPNDIKATLGKVTGSTVAYTETWTLDAKHAWTYSGTFGLVKVGGKWLVHWTPAVLHPKLATGQRLVLVTSVPDHTAVVDRDGKALLASGPSGAHLAGSKGFGLVQSALAAELPSAPSDVFAVERVDSTGHDLGTLYGSTGAVKPARSTLSVAVETAAQSVVDAYQGSAVIVALRPSDGGLLAVAQNSLSGESPFSGLYAPGSTFKIVTATAALESGIATKNSELPCPLTAQIGTRTISNEGFDLGTTTMHRAFAKSCNTTFGRLASQLPPDGLSKAASQYGLNADYDIPGLATQTGKVVPAVNSDQQVEDGIGQGTVQVSPFGEALMAATVAEGHPVTPRLWQDVPTHVLTGYSAPSASVLASLRTMMREVVTDGTGTGLAHSGTVYGKTGTAQFGTGAQANGWFVGFRGNLAFVVFLEGANDSHPAVTLGAKFLAAIK